MVTRNGRRYVAEAKTSRVVANVDSATARRQLLEYRVAFGVNGVVSVDMASGLVAVVELRSRSTSPPTRRRSRATSVWFPVFALGLAAGALLVFFGKH